MKPLAVKLLRLALDPAAQPGEAESAAVKLIRHWRAEGLTADALLAPQARAVGIPCEVMPFGMFKGVRIADVAREDGDYLRWLLLNVRLRRGLREAIEIALANADRNA
jgi:hypothetical protein